jgi:hypothetical protein
MAHRDDTRAATVEADAECPPPEGVPFPGEFTTAFPGKLDRLRGFMGFSQANAAGSPQYTGSLRRPDIGRSRGRLEHSRMNLHRAGTVRRIARSLGDAHPAGRHRPLCNAYVPGFFIAQLCRISTLPSEINDQPIQSGGFTVFLATGLSD